MIKTWEHGMGSGNGAFKAQIYSILHDYTVSADGNISAGTLCEFINGQVRQTYKEAYTCSETQISAVTPTFISAAQLDDNRVYVAGIVTSLKCLILTINSDYSITVGTIYTNSMTCYCPKLIKLDTGRMFVTYCYNSENYSVVTSIDSSNVITFGTQVLHSGSSYTTRSRCAGYLDTDKVVVAWVGASTSYYLYAQVATISGTTITLGTYVTVNSSSTYYPSVAVLEAGKVVFSYCSGTSLTGKAYTISDTTLTPGTALAMKTCVATYTDSVAMSSTKFVTAYNYSGYSVAVIGNVSGTTITVGTEQLSASEYGGYIAIAKIDGTHALLASPVGTDTSATLGLKIITIGDTTITNGDMVYITTAGVSYIAMSNFGSNAYVVAWKNNTSTYWNARVVWVVDGVIYTSYTAHAMSQDAIAVEAGNTGDTVSCCISGIASGFTGLTPSQTYYANEDGTLTTDADGGNHPAVGVALSSTELLKLAKWGGVA